MPLYTQRNVSEFLQFICVIVVAVSCTETATVYIHVSVAEWWGHKSIADAVVPLPLHRNPKVPSPSCFIFPSAVSLLLFTHINSLSTFPTWPHNTTGGLPFCLTELRPLGPVFLLVQSYNWVFIQQQKRSKSCYDWRSISMSWCQVHSGTCDQILFSVWMLLFCLCGTPSLTRGRVCLLSVTVNSV
jgi:hypothetical protein